MPINLTQEFVFETDTLESMRLMLWTSCRLIFEFREESQYVRLHLKKIPPVFFKSDKRVWIATLSDYVSEVKDDDTTFDSLDAIVDEAMERAKQYTLRDLEEQCGDGFSQGFNQSDGSVNVGYRLEMTNSVWRKLELSLVHIYYGK